MTRADVLPVDEMMGKLREVAGEEAAGCVKNLDSESWKVDGGDLASSVGDKTEVFGAAYAELVKLVVQEEEKIAGNTRVIQTPEVDALPRVSSPGPVPSRRSQFLLCFGTCSQISCTKSLGVGLGTPAAPVSTVCSAGKPSFDTDMEFAVRQRGQNVPEYAWVRKDNLAAWTNYEKASLASSSQPTRRVP